MGNVVLLLGTYKIDIKIYNNIEATFLKNEFLNEILLPLHRTYYFEKVFKRAKTPKVDTLAHKSP